MQRGVERGRTELAAVHRREHLDLGDRIEAEPGGDPLGDELDDRRPRRLRIIAADEEEVRVRTRRCIEIGELALVDAVSADDDLARRRLPEDLGQPDHRRGLRLDHLGEHRTGADRGQLINIADEHQLRARAQRGHHRLEQLRVDHRGLVDHEEIHVERILRPAREAVLVGLVFEQAMDRHRLVDGRLAEPLRRTPRRRTERHLAMRELREVHDRLDDRRLADARTTRDHHALVEQRGLHGAPLLAREREVRDRLEGVDRRAHIERGGSRRGADQLREARGSLGLGLVCPRQLGARAAIAEGLANHVAPLLERSEPRRDQRRIDAE